jgi:hypothetical protein
MVAVLHEGVSEKEAKKLFEIIAEVSLINTKSFLVLSFSEKTNFGVRFKN